MTTPLNKKQLYDLVWENPMMEVAKEYGLSDRGLAKLCERNGIPVPPRGYWAKKKAGQKVVQPPLLVLNSKESDTVLLIKHAVQKQETSQESIKEPSLPDEIREAIERESLSQNQVQVAKTLSNPHPIVAKWIQDEERELEMYRKYGGWSKPDKVSDLEKRRRRIISALLKALEARGFKVEADRSYIRFIRVTHQWDKIGFTITERIRQYRRELTEEEKKNRYPTSQKKTQVSEPTGMLMLRISLEPRRSYDAKDFNETAEQPLEDQLNSVIAGFIEKMWWVKKRRLNREEEERQYWKRCQEAEHREKLLKEEQQRKIALETKACNWKKAREVREYVDAVIKACEDKSLAIDKKALASWKEWALAHAKDLDPIASGDPMINIIPKEEDVNSDDDLEEDIGKFDYGK